MRPQWYGAYETPKMLSDGVNLFQPETAIQENGQLLSPTNSPLPMAQTTLVNSAAGAAGALAGWAMSSLSKKVYWHLIVVQN